MQNTEWPLWEVFIRSRQGLDHKHVGEVARRHRFGRARAAFGDLAMQERDGFAGKHRVASRIFFGTSAAMLVGGIYMLASGTGLAPFLSLIQDPETYERFEKVVLVHSVRTVDELAYRDFISDELANHEFFAEMVRDQLIYYPTVTREPFQNRGRITDLIESGKLFKDINLPPLDPAHDRAMICGSPHMIRDCCALLDARGFEVSPHIGAQGDYVIERAFVEK